MLDWITGVIENMLDFSNVLNNSITASWVVLAVLLARFALKKAPKWIHVALWGIVALRMLLPFSIESVFSLIPSRETVPSHLMQAQGTQLHDSARLDIVNNPYFPGNVSLELPQSADRVQISMMLITFVWLSGIAAMLIYTAVSYIRLRRKVSTAVLLRDGIYQSENVTSPFVLGLLRPIIYLPFKADGQTLEHIIAHEQAHIHRRDYIWKPLGFILLSIHWFNPVMWIAYILLCSDIELACDEKVIKDLGNEQRADYSQALLDCSVNRWAIAACPLAFGEVGVKERVSSVLNYKKPAFWLIIAAVIVCVVVAVCFLTDPVGTEPDPFILNCKNAISIVADIQSVTVVYCPISHSNNNLIQIGEVSGSDLASYLDNSNWRKRGEPYNPPPSPGSIEFVINEEYRITVYRYPHLAKVAYNGDICWYRTGWTDYEKAVAIAKPPAENTVNSTSGRTLSLNDVIILSQKGYDLTWEDFIDYEYTETDSGLYIYSYYINDLFSLSIGGTSTEGQPMYIYLSANDGTGDCIDIRDGGVTEFIEKHNDVPAEINYSAIPNEDFPLEGDYLTLHQALYCINYARSGIYFESLNLPKSERVDSVFYFPYSGHGVGECTYFGNGTPCDEWRQNPWHPYPFHSDSGEFISCEPRPVWEICVSYPDSEANATEIIYVDAQTGDMYNQTKRGGYYPSPYTEYSEYARILFTEQINTSTTGNNTTVPTTVQTSAAQSELSDDTLVLIRDYLPGAYVDLKYSSYDNFTGQIIYDFTEPLLRYGTVKKLYLVQQELLELGYSLKIWDAYRPFSAQEKLWYICPDPKYVSDPSSGNLSHCRGSAIDVTIVLADGSEIEMPTGFDDFSAQADRDYSDVSSAARDNALLLQRIMEKNGFKGYDGEWWHYADTENYNIIK